MDATDRLLDAHTAFQLRQLRGPALVALVEEEVDHALIGARRLTLDEVVDRAAVKAVAAKYVSSFQLPGAIPDVAGEIALRLRSHPANATPIGEVFPRAPVSAVIEKVAELQGLRERVVARFVDSPSVRETLAEFLRALATDPIATNRRLVERLPGARSVLSAGERLAGGALRGADQVSREVSQRFAGLMLERWRASMTESLTDEVMAAALLDVWDAVADRPVLDLFEAISEDDLVDLVVVGYEIWLGLRDHPYLHALVDTGVDYVFDTYGEFPLDTLLEEFGLTRDDLVEEALRFAPRALDVLDRAGLLEALVRRRLAAFYDSPEAAAALREDG